MNTESEATNNSKKRVLFINVPSRRGPGGKTVPLGLLYAGSIVERCGHSVKIFDPYLTDEDITKLDSGDYSELDEIFKTFLPDIVGFGGIASSFGRTKILSGYIHRNHPEIFQIAGGPLASVYKFLLTRTNVDLVFHGETERTLPEFLKRYCNGSSYNDIPGISTIDNKGLINRNPLAPQIEELDEIPVPNYDLLNLRGYHFEAMHMITSRGCTHRCSFCYRHMKGHRQHSVPYVINHMKYIIENFEFTHFSFGDELFNANKQWVHDFCDAIEKQQMKISFRASLRADNVDEQLLKRLKEVGCTEVIYGQESGSDTILKEYRKGVDAKTNARVTLMSRAQGLLCPVQIVIGSPSESPITIKETIDFLIGLDEGVVSINYLIPYPETPIWDFVEKNQLISDVEEYLDTVAHWGGSPVINLTKTPDPVWRMWGFQITSAIALANLKKTGKLHKFLYHWLRVNMQLAAYEVIPERLRVYIREKRYG